MVMLLIAFHNYHKKGGLKHCQFLSLRESKPCVTSLATLRPDLSVH